MEPKQLSREDKLKAQARQRYATDSEYRERRKESGMRYRAKSKAKKRAYDRRRYLERQEEFKKKRLELYHGNKNIEREKLRDYYKRNKKAFFYRAADYRARKTKQQISKHHKEALRAIYESCPPGYHVDHIEPLKGKDICGLHVPWNLQYLKAEDNIRKGNRRVEP